MPTTETDIISAIHAKLAGKPRTVTTGQAYDNEAGAMSETTSSEAVELTEELELIIESIVEGLYEKIRADGLEMGATTATTMDVG